MPLQVQLESLAMIAGYVGAGLLLAALLLALLAAALGFRAGLRGRPAPAVSARRALYAATAATAFASAFLLAALAGRDFSLAYVAEHTSTETPLVYSLAAFYGGQEGSLLFWALVLGVLGSGSVARAPAADVRQAGNATGVLSLVLAFFLFLLNFVASPFAILLHPIADGLGLNPLLRDGGMLVHPPFLLAGFACFAVPFSFAIAALLSRRADAAWIRHTRRTALLAWSLQGCGLLLGMWWAYHVLGWGGYWGWDPVENVALLPWLATTAYLHSAQVQERRGALKSWNFGLVILAFLLAVFGTFMVRSGVVQSVHSFSVTPVAPWFLVFLAFLAVASGLLLGTRLGMLRSERPVRSALSREGSYYANNLVLVGLVVAVLWGTLLPVVSPLFGGEQAVVGAPFYTRATGPLFAALLVLLALGPLLPWGGAGRNWRRRLWIPALGAACGTLVLLGAAVFSLPALLAGALVGGAGATAVSELTRSLGLARRPPRAAFFNLLARRRRHLGAQLAHLGLIVLAAGIAGSSFFQLEKQVTLEPGQTVTVGGYELQYTGSTVRATREELTLRASLKLGGETLEPSRTIFTNFGNQSASTAAIRTGPLNDLYVILVEPRSGGRAVLLIFVTPLVSWIWTGGALLILGVLVGNLSPLRVPETSPAPVRSPAMAVPS